jgi:predicted  nucleic acid-binding Zn-ribbon protein
MQPIRFIKRVLPLPLKSFVKGFVGGTVRIATGVATINDRIDLMLEQAEVTHATLAELSHRTSFLKKNLESLELKLRDVSDEVENLTPLNKKVAALELELANCRNLAAVAFQAVEALQSGRAPVELCPHDIERLEPGSLGRK